MFFFLLIGVKVNLKSKLVQSKYIDEKYDLTTENLKELLNERFKNLNIEQTKEDIIRL